MAITEYGFTWGPLTVERAISDPKYGYVLIVKTDSQELEIVSTPAGRKLEARPVRKRTK